MPGMTPQSLSVETLYSEHHGWLQNWLSRRLGCPSLAADLAQDTFVRLLSHPRQLNNLGTPAATCVPSPGDFASISGADSP